MSSSFKSVRSSQSHSHSHHHHHHQAQDRIPDTETDYYSVLGIDQSYLDSADVVSTSSTPVPSGFSNYNYDEDDDSLYVSGNYINSGRGGGFGGSNSNSSSWIDGLFGGGAGIVDGPGSSSYMSNYNANNFDPYSPYSSSATTTIETFSSPSSSAVSGGGTGGGLAGGGSSFAGSTSSWLLVIVLSSIIVITIVGNILVCLAVILVRKLRKPQNYLLVSLATSDLFVALFVMPFATIAEFHETRWPLNPALCDLWVSADVLCCTASILNLCGISLDRYRAITSPLEYSAKTSPKRMLAVIFFVWLGSACVSLPPLLLLGNIHYDEDDPSIPICTVSQNFWYQIYATMMSFYVPLTVMVVVYVKILRVVADKKKEMNWKQRPAPKSVAQLQKRVELNHIVKNGSHKRQLKTDILLNAKNNQNQNGGPLLPPPSQLQSQVTVSPMATTTTTTTTLTTTTTTHAQAAPALASTPNSNTNTATPTFSALHRLKKDKLLGGLREHKASTTLGIIMSAFIICWLPFFVLALVRPFCNIYHVEIPGWVSSLFLWLGYTNSALNPVIYATLNRDFRRPFKEILCLRCGTLDSLMRREFYNQQFGEDTETLRSSAAAKAHAVAAQAQMTNSSSSSRRLNNTTTEVDTPTHL